MSLPEGGEPSPARLSCAYRHAYSCTWPAAPWRRPGDYREGMAGAVPATAVAGGLGARSDRCRDELASAARRTWRISNSYAAISEADGQQQSPAPCRTG
jgi:hypothetical protein